MKRLATRPFTAMPRRQRGAVLVLVVLALLAMLTMAAFALDGGHMLLNKTRLQNAVDAAALSGAKQLSQTPGDIGLAEDAAYRTFELNAEADGNEELLNAMGDEAAGFITVEFSDDVYGEFTATGAVEPRFVRVSADSYPLTRFFWGILDIFGDGDSPDKSVAAVATAGPSPTQPCKVEPLLVCGNPNTDDSTVHNPEEGLYWGFRKGDVTVLKSAAQNDSAIGPGNFQLLDFGSGGKTVEEGLAGGIHDCNVVGETATTEPGNKVGPVAHGLNTRFGDGSTTQYPADYVTDHDEWLTLSDTNMVMFGENSVQSTNGDLTAGSTDLFDYPEYQQIYGEANCPGEQCSLSGGKPDRRILNIVIGDCTGKEAGEFEGKSEIPVLGFACYFTLQPVRQGNAGGGGNGGTAGTTGKNGNGGGTGSNGGQGGGGSGQTAQIFGQFVDQCNGDNVPSATPWDDSGPQIIQLYKTYIDESTPSSDS
ncbi:Tad domain-containing protein [Pseudomonas sp. MOB-449]|nr:Tad domain-containing protein [Pseudomonas sp. MOB-449]